MTKTNKDKYVFSGKICIVTVVMRMDKTSHLSPHTAGIPKSKYVSSINIAIRMFGTFHTCSNARIT